MKCIILTLALLAPGCALLEDAGASGDPAVAAASLEAKLAALEALYADIQDEDSTPSPDTITGLLGLLPGLLGGSSAPNWLVGLLGAYAVYQQRKRKPAPEPSPPPAA